MKIDSTLAAFFRSRLFEWRQNHYRELPWKDTGDPYLIWLSEIILQQTRVEQGLPYYLRFAEAYPSVHDLARAPRDEVLKLWQGLGYYSRARNLHDTARYISEELNGRFPDTYEGILALKGVGPYTAAAIASFAYDLPRAVVDGNVYRILARFFDLEAPVDTTAGKKQFQQIAQDLLDPSQPGRYNQAMMDFGATHCTPKKPACSRCPLADRCRAFHRSTVLQRPKKSKRLQKRERHFNYLIAEDAGRQVVLQQRNQRDIWKQLYEFPLVETAGAVDRMEELVEQKQWPAWMDPARAQLQGISQPYRQTLTHQKIIAFFWEFRLDALPELAFPPYRLVARRELNNFAFPKIVDWYLRDKTLYLNLL